MNRITFSCRSVVTFGGGDTQTEVCQEQSSRNKNLLPGTAGRNFSSCAKILPLIAVSAARARAEFSLGVTLRAGVLRVKLFNENVLWDRI